MTIRPATPKDIEALVALHASGFDTGWDRATLLDFITNDLVFVSGTPMSAFIIVRHILDEAEVITLVVAPEARRLGAGSKLLIATLRELQQRGVRKIFLEVARDNAEALALYHRSGFVQTGLRKAYYARKVGPNIDAIGMTCELDRMTIVTST